MSQENKRKKRDHWEDLSMALNPEENPGDSSNENLPSADETAENVPESPVTPPSPSKKMKFPTKKQDAWSTLASQLGLLSAPIAPEIVAEAASKPSRRRSAESKSEDKGREDSKDSENREDEGGGENFEISVAETVREVVQDAVFPPLNDELPSVLWEPRKVSLKEPASKEPTSSTGATPKVIKTLESTMKSESTVKSEFAADTSPTVSPVAFSSGTSRRGRQQRSHEHSHDERSREREEYPREYQDKKPRQSGTASSEPVGREPVGRMERQSQRSRRDDHRDGRDDYRDGREKKNLRLEEPKQDDYGFQADSRYKTREREVLPESPGRRDRRQSRHNRHEIEETTASAPIEPFPVSAWDHDIMEDDIPAEIPRRGRRHAVREDRESPKSQKSGSKDSKKTESVPLPDFSQIHKKIPSWDEAIGAIIDTNMERQPNRVNRSRSNGRGRRR